MCDEKSATPIAMASRLRRTFPLPTFSAGIPRKLLASTLLVFSCAILPGCGKKQEPATPVDHTHPDILGIPGIINNVPKDIISINKVDKAYGQKAPRWTVKVQHTAENGEVALPESSDGQAVDTNQRFYVRVALSTDALVKGMLEKPISKDLETSILQSRRNTVNIDIVAVPESGAIRRPIGAPLITKLVVDTRKFRDFYQKLSQEDTDPKRLIALPDENASLTVRANSTPSTKIASDISELGNEGPKIAMSGDVIKRSDDNAKREARGATDVSSEIGVAILEFEALGREGVASIALSFWIDHRPVDEISVPVCISTGDTPQCDQSGLSLGASFGTLGQQTHAAPDASIHVLSLGDSHLAGVLYCRTCGRKGGAGYSSWQLARSRDAFVTAMRTEFSTEFEVASNTEDMEERLDRFKSTGRILYNILFESSDQEARPHRSEELFQKFVASSDASIGSPKTLFTRMIAFDRGSLLLPLNVMLVPSSNGREEFLGFKVIVESHLVDHYNSTTAKCIRNWVLLLPERGVKDLALRNSLTPLNEWLSRFDQPTKGSFLYRSDKVRAFQKWLREVADVSVGEAVVTLSHHTDNRLCFSDEYCEKGDIVYASDVQRRFSSPSLVILNACSTGGVNATAFVEQFGRHGVDAVIATSVSVRGEIAGSFLALLARKIDDHSSDIAYSISRARFDAVSELSKLPNEYGVPYGPAALNYMLVGNGKIRVCLPS